MTPLTWHIFRKTWDIPPRLTLHPLIEPCHVATGIRYGRFDMSLTLEFVTCRTAKVKKNLVLPAGTGNNSIENADLLNDHRFNCASLARVSEPNRAIYSRAESLTRKPFSTRWLNRPKVDLAQDRRLNCSAVPNTSRKVWRMDVDKV
jgi:hypothetical protein